MHTNRCMSCMEFPQGLMGRTQWRDGCAKGGPGGSPLCFRRIQQEAAIARGLLVMMMLYRIYLCLFQPSSRISQGFGSGLAAGASGSNGDDALRMFLVDVTQPSCSASVPSLGCELRSGTCVTVCLLTRFRIRVSNSTRAIRLERRGAARSSQICHNEGNYDGGNKIHPVLYPSAFRFHPFNHPSTAMASFAS